MMENLRRTCSNRDPCLYYNKDLVDTAPSTFKDLENLSKDSRFALSQKQEKYRILAKWTDFIIPMV